MAATTDNASMALFCDFENVALGVRDAQYDKFDIRPILERLLAKGSIVVKKAYCDWDRYKAFKSAMHEANFELIEIPHVRQSGKNSADIRLVVDALDLCYTKSHVDTFVIISGDSDFSPLVSKLRENAKRVIGVGVKQSCSDLLIANCDEFIYYDDLVRDREAARHNASRRENREVQSRRSPEEESSRREKLEARKAKAIDLVAATFADLSADRGDTERIWASVLKEVIKRRNPGFNETYFGFRSFGNLLEEAANRGLLGFGRDDKSGAYVTRVLPRAVAADIDLVGELELIGERPAVDAETAPKIEPAAEAPTPSATSARRRGGRRTRKDNDSRNGQDSSVVVATAADPIVVVVPVDVVAAEVVPAEVVPTEMATTEAVAEPRRRGGRRPRKETAVASESPPAVFVVEPLTSVVETPTPEVDDKPRKRPARTPRSRKPKAASGDAAE